MDFGSGPQSFKFNTTVCLLIFLPVLAFLPSLLSSLIIAFGFDLVGTEAAINAKTEPRDHPEGAADLPRPILRMRSVFLRLPPRTP